LSITDSYAVPDEKQENLGKLRKLIGPAIALILCLTALWILRRSLGEYHYRDILRELQKLPARQIFAATLLTLLNYLVLTGYDVLAFRYIRHRLAYAKIALTSFIGYAFSQSLGLPVIMGGSVRYRLYSGWGLSAAEIAQVVAFTTITFWLGIFALGGVALWIHPMMIPHALNIALRTTRPIGLVLIVLAASYSLLCLARRRPFHLGKREFVPPSFGLSMLQVLISSFDWALAAAVLFALLPAGSPVSFSELLGIFLAAQILGVFSQVPGGLGVFETIVLLFLSPRIPAPALVGSLLAYRGIYYLFPLCVALVVLAAHEIWESSPKVGKIANVLARGSFRVSPSFFAFATFAAGVVLLFSGATPAARARLMFLQQFLPLTLVEISHFLASLAGIGLILLARGLQKRLDAAWMLTVILLATGLVASLLKGLDYEESVLMGVLLFSLLPCRAHFYRKASLTSERFSPAWIAAIALVLASSLWLTFFSFEHVPYSTELWWQFTFSGDAPRSLRAAVGAFGAAFIFALAQLLRPASAAPTLPGGEELEHAKELIAGAKKTYANLALLGDKELLFSKSGNSFLMYGMEGRSWIALGDPIGSDEEKPELIWRFRELSDNHAGWTVFYQIEKQYLPLYLDLGLTLLKLGEEALVRLEDFTLDGKDRKTFRHLLNKFDKDGFNFEIVSPSQVSSLFPVFREISDQWLQQKNTREKGFSLGFFNTEYLKCFPAAIVRRGDTIYAFTNIWVAADKEELSLDLMRYRPDAPNGVMDYLFLNLMLWGKEEGYRWFNLGMAPLSGLQNHALAPFWSRLGALVYRYGEHFYNFQGLRQYKQKFDPVWEPKYIATPAGLALPRVLSNLGSLISGGLGGVVTR
jgi:phosphatidylglycerol lysyltransferase